MFLLILLTSWIADDDTYGIYDDIYDIYNDIYDIYNDIYMAWPRDDDEEEDNNDDDYVDRLSIDDSVVDDSTHARVMQLSFSWFRVT